MSILLKFLQMMHYGYNESILKNKLKQAVFNAESARYTLCIITAAFRYHFDALRNVNVTEMNGNCGY